MEKGAKREGKTAWDIAKFYTEAFLTDSKKLNLLDPEVRPKPTEHIKEQIEMVATLIKKGFAYTIDDGIYFDTSKCKNYGELTGQSLDELKEGARVEPNPEKDNPTDFALWKFSYPRGRSFDPARDASRRDMEWESPWGMGFPGWHIECSAMSRKHLGDQIDIHTGGADLIPIHHTNEIAQSEAATGKSPFVKYWVHGQFIMVDGEKMSKSKGNFYRLADVEAKGFDPLDLRYLYLTAHYRAFLNFTWKGLESARKARLELVNLVKSFLAAPAETEKNKHADEIESLQKKFQLALENDLNIPQALAAFWEAARSSQLSAKEKYNLLIQFDRVLGLNLDAVIAGGVETIPDDINELVKKRQECKMHKNYSEADSLRKQIEEKGYSVEDTPQGIRVKKRVNPF